MNALALKLIGVAVGGGMTLLCVAAATPAESERTSAERTGQRPDRPRVDRPEGQLRTPGSWRDRAAATRATKEEWTEIEAFMTEHSPKRWTKFKEMPEDRQSRLRGFVVPRYRMIQEMKQNDVPMYDLRINRLHIEDDIFSLGWDLKNSKAENASESTRAELRKKIRALADSRIEEHRLRLKQWAERMEQERKKLADEQSSVDQFVKTSMEAIESDMRWPVMADLPIPNSRGGSQSSPGRDTRFLAPATQSTTPEK